MEKKREPERKERRKRDKREALPSLKHLRRSGSRFLADQHVDTKNSKFGQGFAREVREVKRFEFRKCPRDFLGMLLTLQEVGILSTLVYFPFYGLFG